MSQAEVDSYSPMRQLSCRHSTVTRQTRVLLRMRSRGRRAPGDWLASWRMLRLVRMLARAENKRGRSQMPTTARPEPRDKVAPARKYQPDRMLPDRALRKAAGLGSKDLLRAQPSPLPKSSVVSRFSLPLPFLLYRIRKVYTLDLSPESSSERRQRRSAEKLDSGANSRVYTASIVKRESAHHYCISYGRRRAACNAASRHSRHIQCRFQAILGICFFVHRVCQQQDGSAEKQRVEEIVQRHHVCRRCGEHRQGNSHNCHQNR